MYLNDPEIIKYIQNKYPPIENTNSVCIGVRFGQDFEHKKKFTVREIQKKQSTNNTFRKYYTQKKWKFYINGRGQFYGNSV